MDKNTINIEGLILPKLLMRAKQLLVSVAEKNDLTTVQVCLLSMIDPDQPKTMTSLARMLHNDASNVTGLIDRLESQGLVTRTDDPKDRRIKVISLTSNGKKLRDDIKKSLSKAEADMVSSLTPDERKIFRELLNKI